MQRTLRLLLSLAALAAAVSALPACGSDDGTTAGACTEHSDCEVRGQFCSMDGVCAEQTCATSGDCPSEGLVCAVDIGKCVPRECGAGAETEECPAGFTCERGACVANSGGEDVVQADVIEGTDVQEPPEDVTPDVPAPPVVAACAACEGDVDCGEGMTCEQLGATKNCVAACTEDADCTSGWVCYPLTNEGNACVPAAFSCAAPCLVDGCPAGKTCDQIEDSGTFGTCVDAAAECATCESDWQCGAGLRCGTTAGGLRFCLPECGDGNCPAWAVCAEKGGLGGEGVMFCRPTHPTCCGAECAVEECDPACSGNLPVCHNQTCVQCDSDDDCAGATETCNTTTYRCTGGPCSDSPSTPHEFNGSCVQCLQDSHCGNDGDCDEGTHTCAGGDPCGGVCAVPYPGCAVINGVPSCVPCTLDAHCTGGATCNATTYACEGTGPVGCAGDCLLNSCPNTTGQFDLECDPVSGCCYDKTGLCDNVEAFCKGSSECKSIFEIFGGGGLPTIPGMEGGFAGGMCTCDAAFGAICGFMPDNPLCADVPMCYEGVSCNAIGTILQFLTGGAGGALVMGDFCSAPLF